MEAAYVTLNIRFVESMDLWLRGLFPRMFMEAVYSELNIGFVESVGLCLLATFTRMSMESAYAEADWFLGAIGAAAPTKSGRRCNAHLQP